MDDQARMRLDAAAHRSAQSPIGVTPAADNAPWARTEYAGRGAGRTNASPVVGRTIAGSSPSAPTTARANSCQDVRPEDVPWYVPAGAALVTRRWIRSARSTVQVG